jgi:hypothetical protein
MLELNVIFCRMGRAAPASSHWQDEWHRLAVTGAGVGGGRSEFEPPWPPRALELTVQKDAAQWLSRGGLLRV